VCLHEGKGGRGDRRAAVVWFRTGAAAGNVYAISMLGRCLRDGLGAPRRPKAGSALVLHAARLGLTDALLWRSDMETVHKLIASRSCHLPQGIAQLPWRTVGTILIVEVPESAKEWPLVNAWVRESGDADDHPHSTFSADEIRHARWNQVWASWNSGYPQPNPNRFGYLQATYDLAAYCSRCGSGKKQNAAFRLAAEPKWGRRHILQLNWVGDEFFVRRETWEKVFRPFGVPSRPVLNTRGATLSDTVQLVFSEGVPVSTVDLPGRECPVCGRMKYLPIQQGFAPAPTAQSSAHAVRSSAVFGGGGIVAFNLILISQALAAALEENGIKDVSLTPVTPDAWPAHVNSGPTAAGGLPHPEDLRVADRVRGRAEAPARPQVAGQRTSITVATIEGALAESNDAGFLTLLSDYLSSKFQRVRFDGMRGPERVAFCVDEVLGEVNNGGFSQYFFNSSGDRTENAVAALTAIGALDAADVMREAIALFPGGDVPTDCQERRVLLGKAGEEVDALWENQDAEFWGISADIVTALRRFVENARHETEQP
jgi:hypothetical protein